MVERHRSRANNEHVSVSPLAALATDDADESTSESGEEVENDLGIEIIRGNSEEISDDTWLNIEEAKPDQMTVVKDVSQFGYTDCMLAVGNNRSHDP